MNTPVHSSPIINQHNQNSSCNKTSNDDKNIIKLIYNYLKNEKSIIDSIYCPSKLENLKNVSSNTSNSLDNTTNIEQTVSSVPSSSPSPSDSPSSNKKIENSQENFSQDSSKKFDDTEKEFLLRFESFLRNTLSLLTPSDDLLNILSDFGWKNDIEIEKNDTNMKFLVSKNDTNIYSNSTNSTSIEPSFIKGKFIEENFDPLGLCDTLGRKLLKSSEVRRNSDIYNKEFLKLSPTSMFVPQMLLNYLIALVKFNNEKALSLSKEFFSVTSEMIVKLEQEIIQLEYNIVKKKEEKMVLNSPNTPSTVNSQSFFSESLPNSNKISSISEKRENTNELVQLLPPLPLFPSIFSFECACMIVDISGFTRLSGQFCAMGKAGIDKLQQATNGYLGDLVDIIYQYGGDIIKFAGDAIICIFVSDNIRESLNSKFDSLFEWSFFNQQLSVDNWYQQQLFFQFKSLIDKKNKLKLSKSDLKNPNDFDLKPPHLTPCIDNPCSRHDLCIQALNCSLKLAKSQTSSFTAHIGVTYGMCDFLMVGGGIQLPPYSSVTNNNIGSNSANLSTLSSPQNHGHGYGHSLQFNMTNNFISMNSQYMKQINEWLVSGKFRPSSSLYSNESFPLDATTAKLFSTDRDEWEFLIDGECLSFLSKCLDDAPSMHVCVTPDFRAALLDPLTLNNSCKLPNNLNNNIQTSEISDINILKTGKEILNYGELDGCFEFVKLPSNNYLVSSVENSISPNISSISTDSQEASSHQESSLNNSIISFASTISNFNSLNSIDLNTRRQLNNFVDKFVPIPVSSALKSGGSLGLLAEIREVTVMFINLTSHSWKNDLDYHKFLYTKQVLNFDHHDNTRLISHYPPYLQLTFTTLQSYIRHYGGFLRQLIVDDKGCVAIACWGVSSSSYLDNGKRATTAAIKILQHWNTVKNNYNKEVNDPNLYNPLEKVYLKPLDISVGITTGSAYCGIVGKKGFRGEFAMVGSTVNLSARLMSSALKFSHYYYDLHKNDIIEKSPNHPQLSLIPPKTDTFVPLKFPLLIDAATQNTLSFEWSPYFQSLPPITVKGKTEPVDVWAFRALNELDNLSELTDEDEENFIPDFLPPSVEESKIKDSIKIALYKCLEEIKPRSHSIINNNLLIIPSFGSSKHETTKSSPTSFLYKSTNKKRSVHKILLEGKMGTGKASVIRWFTDISKRIKNLRVLGIILESHGDHSYSKDSKFARKNFIHDIQFDNEYLLIKYIFYGMIDLSISIEKEKFYQDLTNSSSYKLSDDLIEEERKNYLYHMLIRMSDNDDDIEKLAIPIISTIFGIHLDINKLIKLRRTQFSIKQSSIKEEGEDSKDESIIENHNYFSFGQILFDDNELCQSCDTSSRSPKAILSSRTPKLPKWMIHHILKEIMSFLITEFPTVITVEHLQFADDASIRCISEIQNLIPHINSVFIFTILDNEGVFEYNSMQDSGKHEILSTNISPSSLFSNDHNEIERKNQASTSNLEEVPIDHEYMNDFYDNHNYETDGNQITLETIKRIKQNLCSNMEKNPQIKKIFGDDINNFHVKDNNTEIFSLSNLNVLEINKMLNSMLSTNNNSTNTNSSLHLVPHTTFTGVTGINHSNNIVPIGLAEQVHHLTGGSVFWVNEILNFMKTTGIEEFMRLIDFNSSTPSPIKTNPSYVKSTVPESSPVTNTNIISPRSNLSLSVEHANPINASLTQPLNEAQATPTELIDEKKSVNQLHLLILTRYARLNPNLQAVLKSAAIIGSRFTYGSLSSICMPEHRARLRIKLNSLVKDNWLRHKCRCIHIPNSNSSTKGDRGSNSNNNITNRNYQSSYNYYNYVSHNSETEGWGIVNEDSNERNNPLLTNDGNSSTSASSILTNSLSNNSSTPLTCKGDSPCVYYFKHHILHDVILSLIPSSDRQKLHQQVCLYYQSLLIINYHWDTIKFEFNKDEGLTRTHSEIDDNIFSSSNSVVSTNINYNIDGSQNHLLTPQNIHLQRYYYLEVLHHCQAGALGQMGFFFSVTKLHQLIYDILLFISPNFTKPQKSSQSSANSKINKFSYDSDSDLDFSDNSFDESDCESDDDFLKNKSIKIPGTEYYFTMNAMNISMLLMPLKLVMNDSFKNLVIDIMRYARKSLMMVSSRADVMVLATVLERLDLGIQHWKMQLEKKQPRQASANPLQTIVHSNSLQGNSSTRIRNRPRFLSASSISKNSFYLPSTSPSSSEKNCLNCGSCKLKHAIQTANNADLNYENNKKKRKRFLDLFFSKKIFPTPSSVENTLSQKVSKKRRKKRKHKKSSHKKSLIYLSLLNCCSTRFKVAIEPKNQKQSLHNPKSPFSPMLSSLSPSLYSYCNPSDDNSPIEAGTNTEERDKDRKSTCVLNVLEALVEKCLKGCDDFDEILTAHKDSSEKIQTNIDLNLTIDYSNIVTLSDWQLLIINDPKFQFLNESLYKKKYREREEEEKSNIIKNKSSKNITSSSFISRSNFITKYISGYFTSSQLDSIENEKSYKMNASSSKPSISFLQSTSSIPNNSYNNIEFSKSLPTSPTVLS